MNPTSLPIVDALVAHLMALLIVSGFIGIGYVAVLGFIDLKDPVVTGFVGTLIGAFGTKAEVVMVKYFGAIALKQAQSNGRREADQ